MQMGRNRPAHPARTWERPKRKKKIGSHPAQWRLFRSVIGIRLADGFHCELYSWICGSPVMSSTSQSSSWMGFAHFSRPSTVVPVRSTTEVSASAALPSWASGQPPVPPAPDALDQSIS
ncbi:hypothetical protein Nepgr_033433 [Nepenthes gracilis]|uniref:Uncharacterized protein n=1 Tax=Nepenthes gracilis TaxID=150966 RepID=A0AAD3Y8N4_NEPGR|nr:hypothetical protein Nepgr_033433 [Nepenthes gracilis]